MNKRVYFKFLVVFCVSFTFIFTSCSKKVSYHPKSVEKISIVCVSSVEAEIAKNICGEKANISVLISDNNSKDEYNFSKKDFRKIQKCNLFICCGDESDEEICKTVRSLKKPPRIFSLSDQLDIYEVISNPVLTEDVINSPKNSIKIARSLYKELLLIDSKNASTYIQNTNYFINSLTLLEKQSNITG